MNESRVGVCLSGTGKLCLQHDDLAKESIPVLVRELEVGIDGNVLNNIVIVLCDLCVRYTALVDKYIPTICTCLKDPNPFVRKQALLLLTGLLQVCVGAACQRRPLVGVGGVLWAEGG